MQVERGASESLLEGAPSGGRVSNTWVICLTDRDNRVKTLLIPDTPPLAGAGEGKGEIRWEMSPRLIS